jgi:hypothetical protein
MATKHLHKYKLRDLARKKDTPPYLVYVCTKQDCSHHIRIDLVDGKEAECNRCGDIFIMKLSKLKHGDRVIVRPHCDNCTKTPGRVKVKKESISSSIDELMSSILPKELE